MCITQKIRTHFFYFYIVIEKMWDNINKHKVVCDNNCMVPSILAFAMTERRQELSCMPPSGMGSISYIPFAHSWLVPSVGHWAIYATQQGKGHCGTANTKPLKSEVGFTCLDSNDKSQCECVIFAWIMNINLRLNWDPTRIGPKGMRTLMKNT